MRFYNAPLDWNYERFGKYNSERTIPILPYRHGDIPMRRKCGSVAYFSQQYPIVSPNVADDFDIATYISGNNYIRIINSRNTNDDLM